ncbi:MAG: hypothetical protein ACYC2Y_08125 [Armatimonadota bacterium]
MKALFVLVIIALSCSIASAEGGSGSLLFSPNSGIEKPAIGLQYMQSGDGVRYGASFWVSGSLDSSGDEMGDLVPVDLVKSEGETGSISGYFLVGFGGDESMLVVGLGYGEDYMHYKYTSEMTGLEYSEDEPLSRGIRAQVSYMGKIGGNTGLQVGYDTKNEWFFGVSSKFE